VLVRCERLRFGRFFILEYVFTTIFENVCILMRNSVKVILLLAHPYKKYYYKEYNVKSVPDFIGHFN